MILYPNCKINLGLNIVGKRPDGYHDIETIFLPIPLSDVLELEPSYEDVFQINGQSLDCSAKDNLVVKVIDILRRDGINVPPVSVALTKNIPSGAGLGGGSSDAAFMMKGLNDLFNLGLSNAYMESMVAKLGADCAVFVKNTPVYASGIGNVFTNLSLDMKQSTYCVLPPVGAFLPPTVELSVPIALSGYWLVLVKPDVHVSTRDAYRGVTPHKPDISLQEMILQPVGSWRASIVNDFEDSIFCTIPLLGEIKGMMYSLGADYAAMSGSGSTIYGLFPEKPILGDVFAEHFQWETRL